MRKKLLVFFSGLLFFIPSLFSQEAGKEPLSACAKIGIALGVGLGVCGGGYLLYTRAMSTSEETKKRFEEDARNRARRAREGFDDRATKAALEAREMKDIDNRLTGLVAAQKAQEYQREGLASQVRAFAEDSTKYSEMTGQNCRILSSELRKANILGENIQELRLRIEGHGEQQDAAKKILRKELLKLGKSSQMFGLEIEDQRIEMERLRHEVRGLSAAASCIKDDMAVIRRVLESRHFESTPTDDEFSKVPLSQTPDLGNRDFWAARGRVTCRQEASRYPALMGGH